MIAWISQTKGFASAVYRTKMLSVNIFATSSVNVTFLERTVRFAGQQLLDCLLRYHQRLAQMKENRKKEEKKKRQVKAKQSSQNGIEQKRAHNYSFRSNPISCVAVGIRHTKVVVLYNSGGNGWAAQGQSSLRMLPHASLETIPSNLSRRTWLTLVPLQTSRNSLNMIYAISSSCRCKAIDNV